MGGAVVEKLCDGNGGGLCAFGLGGRKEPSATNMVESIARA
jgi:hypothetical protein